MPEVKWNNAKDIEDALGKVSFSDVRGFAKALSEADEWQFPHDQEEAAGKALEKGVSDLRARIRVAVIQTTDQALHTPDGTTGSKQLARAAEFLALYPQPSSETENAEAEDLSARISKTSRRLEDLQRLRFNDWAALQIEQALIGFHGNKKTFGDDSDALINSCVSTLGTVETASLEPAVLSLYQQALSLTTEALSEANKVKLAKAISSTLIKRKSPADY